MRTAIKAGWLICSAQKVIQNGVMIIEDQKITHIFEQDEWTDWKQQPQNQEICVEDYGSDIIFPGFVNAHMHQYGILSHGIPQVGEVIDFETFLKNYWWPFIENRITKKEVEITTKVTMAEMLHSGITAFCDILEAPCTEEDTLITQGKIIEETGMRAIVSLESSQRIDDENGEKCLKQNAEAAEYFNNYGKTVKGAICTHTTFTCTPEFIKKAADYAKKTNSMLQFHLSESKYEPEWTQKNLHTKPTYIYEEMEALSDQTIATQCVKVDAEECEILKKYGTKVVHMPVSNCEVGGGIAPIPQMLEMGMEPALGTDGYMNDFFMVMKEAFLIHKAEQESTEVMPSWQVFQMATEYGAKAMGLNNCGILKEGYLADFVVYKDLFPTPVTMGNIFDQLVVHGKSTAVTDVVIDGKYVMKNGIIPTLDETKLCQEMRQCAEEFWR